MHGEDGSTVCPQCGGPCGEYKAEIGGRTWCSQKCWRTMMDSAPDAPAEKDFAQPGEVLKVVAFCEKCSRRLPRKVEIRKGYEGKENVAVCFDCGMKEVS